MASDAPTLELPLQPSLDGCPYLGFEADPQTHAGFVERGHRCFRTTPPSAISGPHQAVFCLTSRYPFCSRYQGYVPVGGRTARRRRPLPVGPVLVLIGVAALSAAAAVRFVGNPFAAEPEPSPSAPVAVATPASPGASPTLTGAGAPSPTAAPTAVPPTATVFAPPAPIATPTPAAARTYTVQAGDSLTALARRFGVSVQALAAANGLAPTANLFVGQQLKVPPAPSP